MKGPADLLREGLRELDIPHAEEQIGAFQIYLTELRKWNRVHNLTGLKEEREIVIKHFLDSLLFLKVIPADTKRIADVGAGAGFPGIPMKIMRPELQVILIEPSEKKCVFLRHMKAILGLTDLEVITSRIGEVEELTVDMAVTRALFSVRDFMKKAEKIIGDHGLLLLSKGPRLKEELRGLDPDRITVTDLRLPFSTAVRHMVIVKR